MRYEIRTIIDCECTQVDPDELLASTNDSVQAKLLAAQHSASTYGAAIVDTLTGEIDFGNETLAEVV